MTERTIFLEALLFPIEGDNLGKAEVILGR